MASGAQDTLTTSARLVPLGVPSSLCCQHCYLPGHQDQCPAVFPESHLTSHSPQTAYFTDRHPIPSSEMPLLPPPSPSSHFGLQLKEQQAQSADRPGAGNKAESDLGHSPKALPSSKIFQVAHQGGQPTPTRQMPCLHPISTQLLPSQHRQDRCHAHILHPLRILLVLAPVTARGLC